MNAAELSIPNRIVSFRMGGPRWLTTSIRKQIRKKNRLHKKAKRHNKLSYWDKFRKIPNDVTALIRKSRDDYNNDLIKKTC